MIIVPSPYPSSTSRSTATRARTYVSTQTNRSTNRNPLKAATGFRHQCPAQLWFQSPQTGGAAPNTYSVSIACELNPGSSTLALSGRISSRNFGASMPGEYREANSNIKPVLIPRWWQLVRQYEERCTSTRYQTASKALQQRSDQVQPPLAREQP